MSRTHEAGHALAAHFSRSVRVESVSIGRGGEGVLCARSQLAGRSDGRGDQAAGSWSSSPATAAERYCARPRRRDDDDDPWLTPAEMVMLDAEPVVIDAPSDEAVVEHFTKRLGLEEDRGRAGLRDRDRVERHRQAGRLEQLADELLWRTSLTGEDLDAAAWSDGMRDERRSVGG